MRRSQPCPEQDLIPGVVGWNDVEWDRAESVRYHVRQRFTYRYEGPVWDIAQRLVVLPPLLGGDSRRLAHDFQVDAEAGVVVGEDEFGNTILSIRVPRVEGEVTFDASFVAERLRAGRPGVMDPVAADRFLAHTRRTAPGPALRRLAATVPATGDWVERAHATCIAVHAALRYQYGITNVLTSAEDALVGGVGVCQDYAHIMVSVCRQNGIPSRYVSGHLVGEGGTHAWVEVLSGDGQVRAFDPTHGRAVGMSYLPIARGRDYGDVAPTSGTYVGEWAGRLETTRRVAICGYTYA